MSFYSGKIIKESARRKPKFLLIGLVILLALVGGGYVALDSSGILDQAKLYRCYWDASIGSTAYSKTTGIKAITIEPGLEPLTIGQLLQQNDVIANANDFLCYVRKIDSGNKIQAGYYEIQLPVSIEQLVPMLQAAQIQTVRVTLPEGLRMDEIATKLDKALNTNNTRSRFSAEEFLILAADRQVVDEFAYTKGKVSLEGFLFPDTYELAKNATTREVLELLLTTFTNKVTASAPIATASNLTPYQVVVLASIIEKEAGKSYEEKQTIAGILLKRMKSGWFLQVDAVFLYEKKDWKAPITIQDISLDSPYNTYKRMGLPPTPIDNPGLDSIKAVLNPKSSNYWFYLHGTDGIVRYAATNDEHLRNKSLYLR